MIRPSKNRIVVEDIKHEEEKIGNIILPGGENGDVRRGRVLETHVDSEERYDIDAVVLYLRRYTYPFRDNGKELFLVDIGDILATLE